MKPRECEFRSERGLCPRVTEGAPWHPCQQDGCPRPSIDWPEAEGDERVRRALITLKKTRPHDLALTNEMVDALDDMLTVQIVSCVMELQREVAKQLSLRDVEAAAWAAEREALKTEAKRLRAEVERMSGACPCEHRRSAEADRDHWQAEARGLRTALDEAEEDALDVAEAQARLADPDQVTIPYSEARRLLGLRQENEDDER